MPNTACFNTEDQLKMQAVLAKWREEGYSREM